MHFVMVHSEFKAVDKSFEGYFNVGVEDAWNNFSEVHGFLFYLAWCIGCPENSI